MIFKQAWLIEMHFPMFINTAIDQTRKLFLIPKCLCFFNWGSGKRGRKLQRALISILFCNGIYIIVYWNSIVIYFEIWKSVAKSFRMIFKCAVVILEILGARKWIISVQYNLGKKKKVLLDHTSCSHIEVPKITVHQASQDILKKAMTSDISVFLDRT